MKPNYYAIITAEVRYDKELPPNAKLLYGEISALANQKGYCYATNKYFADLYDVAEKTISEWIKQLKIRGHIHCESPNSYRRKIYIKIPSKRTVSKGHPRPTVEPSGNPDRSVRKNGGFRQENLTQNTTSNTTSNTGEDKSSQSYELEPTDHEGNPITPRGKSKTVPLLRRIEKLRGSKFGNEIKQKKYIKMMLDSGIPPKAVGVRWKELRDSEWWQKQGLAPDLKNVADSFDKKPYENK